MSRYNYTSQDSKGNRGSLVRVALASVISVGICLGGASMASAFSYAGTEGDAVADLINTPNKIYTFDPPVITWKMTTRFLNHYPLAKQREQVRLAIAEWEEGMFSFVRRAAPTYAWLRFSGRSDFFDLRSVLTHEIGHALGSQHTDAAWFNDSGDGTPYYGNYRPSNGGLVAAPPQGGEIMNEGNKAGFLPQSKPPKGLGPGEIWRTLSQDELDFLDHGYPVAIDFVEVGPNEEADLIIDLFGVGAPPGQYLGNGAPDSTEVRDPADASQGERILRASALVRETASYPIGFKALPRAWEIQNNTGEPINSVIITARGTNNPIPTSWSSGGNKAFTFQGALAPPPVPDPRAFNLEDVAHLYTQASNGPINSGESVTIGLQKDVWDWTVVDSKAFQEDGDFVDMGLLSISDVKIEGVIPGVARHLSSSAEGLEAREDLPIIAHGFKVGNAGPMEVSVPELAFAATPDQNPFRTELLNAARLDELESLNKLQKIVFEPPLTLGPDEEYYILLGGTSGALPAEVLQSGNWMASSLPGQEELGPMFIYAKSHGGGFSVGNYVLVDPPVFTDDDNDGDNIGDSVDACLETQADAVVDETGCSVAQLCTCDDYWKNHGHYVACVVQASGEFEETGLLTKQEKAAMVRSAAQSQCGKGNS